MKNMKLHDYFNQQAAITNIDLEMSRKWMNNPYLRFERESLLCAAQEQALATNYIQSKIWGSKSGTYENFKFKKGRKKSNFF